MNTPAPVVTRFAPSPTGLLHVGGARTALFAYAFAKRHQGQFLLRLEDTDQKRSSEASAQAIVEDLQWLGLHADNESDIPRQSDRKVAGIYDAVINQLIEQGDAFEDDGAVRFRMGEQRGDVTFDDAVFGAITTPAADLEDFVIRKADGFPTFHLAVVVDDHDMHVTHVIRGAEHLSNTPKHAALYDALGYPRPVWAHTPSIMNPDGSKMSKRDKAKVARKAAKDGQLADDAKIALDSVDDLDAFLVGEKDDVAIAVQIASALGITLPEIDVADFRSSGYLPDVLLNYLSLLGWNPGDDVERFDMAFLCERFDLPRIQKGNSKFDRDKLLAFNAETLQQIPSEDFAEKLLSYMKTQPTPLAKQLIEQVGEQFQSFAAAYQPRTRKLSDPAQMGRFFVEAPADYDAKAVKKWLMKNEATGITALRDVVSVFESTEPWADETIHAAVAKFAEDQGMKNMGVIAQPIRVAMTGSAVSPEIGITLELLGKDETLKRIEACLVANPVE